MGPPARETTKPSGLEPLYFEPSSVERERAATGDAVFVGMPGDENHAGFVLEFELATGVLRRTFSKVEPRAFDRFGAALPRFSPRQSDLLMVVGTVTHKQAPILLKVYEQMCEPKWVMAFGACATSGGFYQNYATLLGIDRIIPVDVYVPGCPPRPETVIDGIMQLQDRIARQRHPIVNERF